MDTTTQSAGRGIGALSKRTGCNIETIRYYERIGLMPPAARSDGGHRRYGESQGRRLGFIRRTRELGFTLDQVRTLLALVDGGRYTCTQVKRMTVQHLGEVRRKVADLRKIERVLRGWHADRSIEQRVNDGALGHAWLSGETRGGVLFASGEAIAGQ